MLHHNDFNEVYQAVEEAISVNAGVNNVVFNVKGIIGAGVGHSTRFYYVPIYFPNADKTVRYRAALVTVRPLSSPNRTTGTMMPGVAGTGVATYPALLSAIAITPIIANDTSAPISAVANMTL